MRTTVMRLSDKLQMAKYKNIIASQDWRAVIFISETVATWCKACTGAEGNSGPLKRIGPVPAGFNNFY